MGGSAHGTTVGTFMTSPKDRLDGGAISSIIQDWTPESKFGEHIRAPNSAELR